MPQMKCRTTENKSPRGPDGWSGREGWGVSNEGSQFAWWRERVDGGGVQGRGMQKRERKTMGERKTAEAEQRDGAPSLRLVHELLSAADATTTTPGQSRARISKHSLPLLIFPAIPSFPVRLVERGSGWSWSQQHEGGGSRTQYELSTSAEARPPGHLIKPPQAMELAS
jgi:hypothetical protein